MTYLIGFPMCLSLPRISVSTIIMGSGLTRKTLMTFAFHDSYFFTL